MEKKNVSKLRCTVCHQRLQDLGKEDMFEITGKNVASELRINQGAKNSS
jgi:hypothetical protein